LRFIFLNEGKGRNLSQSIEKKRNGVNKLKENGAFFRERKEGGGWRWWGKGTVVCLRERGRGTDGRLFMKPWKEKRKNRPMSGKRGRGYVSFRRSTPCCGCGGGGRGGEPPPIFAGKKNPIIFFFF